MHTYYCRKCKRDSMSPVCEYCGTQISALNQNERFRWKMLRMPLGDGATLASALRVLIVALTILFLYLFIGELVSSPDKQRAIFLITMNGELPWLLLMLGVGAGAVLLMLGLQGVEERHFVLDSRGAHLQIWIEPSRRKCFARLMRYDERRIAAGPDGEARMMIGESHIVWSDVCRYEVKKRACRIDLYRPSSFRFMSIYAEKEEFDAVQQYTAQRLKHLQNKAQQGKMPKKQA